MKLDRPLVMVVVSVGSESMWTVWELLSVSSRYSTTRRVRSLIVLGCFCPLILVRRELESSLRTAALGLFQRPRRGIKAGMMGRLAQMTPVESSAALELISHIWEKFVKGTG